MPIADDGVLGDAVAQAGGLLGGAGAGGAVVGLVLGEEDVAPHHGADAFGSEPIVEAVGVVEEEFLPAPLLGEFAVGVVAAHADLVVADVEVVGPEEGERLGVDGLDEAVGLGVGDGVGVGVLRVLGEVEVLVVLEHPLGVAEGLDERDGLDVVLPGELDVLGDLLLGDGVDGGELGVGIPLGVVALEDEAIHLVAGDDALEEFFVQGERVLAGEQVDAAEREGGVVVDAAGGEEDGVVLGLEELGEGLGGVVVAGGVGGGDDEAVGAAVNGIFLRAEGVFLGPVEEDGVVGGVGGFGREGVPGPAEADAGLAQGCGRRRRRLGGRSRSWCRG